MLNICYEERSHRFFIGGSVQNCNFKVYSPDITKYKKTDHMNRTLFSFILIYFSIGSAFPQDTTYYYSANNIPSDPEHAGVKHVMTGSAPDKYKVSLFARTDKHWEPVSNVTVKIRDENEYQVREFRKGRMIKSYTRYYSRTPSGLYEFVEKQHNDTIRTGTSSTRLPLTLEGIETEYYPGGQKKSESVYENNRLISNKSSIKRSIFSLLCWAIVTSCLAASTLSSARFSSTTLSAPCSVESGERKS